MAAQDIARAEADVHALFFSWFLNIIVVVDWVHDQLSIVNGSVTWSEILHVLHRYSVLVHE